jgi:hypothetical protein
MHFRFVSLRLRRWYQLQLPHTVRPRYRCALTASLRAIAPALVDFHGLAFLRRGITAWAFARVIGPIHCPLGYCEPMHDRDACGRSNYYPAGICLQTTRGDKKVQRSRGATIRQAYVQSLLAPLGRLLCNRLSGSGRHKVLKSGAAEYSPTKRSKLWTNPVALRSGMPNSTFSVRQA